MLLDIAFTAIRMIIYYNALPSLSNDFNRNFALWFSLILAQGSLFTAKCIGIFFESKYANILVNSKWTTAKAMVMRLSTFSKNSMSHIEVSKSRISPNKVNYENDAGYARFGGNPLITNIGRSKVKRRMHRRFTHLSTKIKVMQVDEFDVARGEIDNPMTVKKNRVSVREDFIYDLVFFYNLLYLMLYDTAVGYMIN